MYKDPSYGDKFYDPNRIAEGKVANGTITRIDKDEGSVMVFFPSDPRIALEADCIEYELHQYAEHWDPTTHGGIYMLPED